MNLSSIVSTGLGLVVKAKAAILECAVFALIVAAATAFGYGWGVEHEREFLTAKHQAEMQSLRADLSDQVAKAEKHARDVERASIDNMAATVAAYETRDHESNAEILRLGDALHAGSVRLLDRFTCGRAVSGQAPTPGASAPGASDGTGGLSRADAEFLVRFAGRAQHDAERLRALQAIVQHDREVTP